MLANTFYRGAEMQPFLFYLLKQTQTMILNIKQTYHLFALGLFLRQEILVHCIRQLDISFTGVLIMRFRV